MGFGAGEILQGDDATAVGHIAGNSNQGNLAVALGNGAGAINQGIRAIAIGSIAGYSGQGAGSITIDASGAGVAPTANTWFVRTGDAAGLRTDTGTALAYTASYEIVKSSSSRRYKANIADLTSDTSRVYDLRPREFDYVGAATYRRNVGYIAEEIPDIRMVHTDIQGRVDALDWPAITTYAVAELRALRDDTVYAGYFEAEPAVGQAEPAVPPGRTVALSETNPGMVREAVEGDDIIGVVRPKIKSTTLGNSAENEWQGKYLRDVYGAILTEAHSIVSWTETVVVQEEVPAVLDPQTGDIIREAIPAVLQTVVHRYETHAMPPGVVAPPDATYETHDPATGEPYVHRKINPAYDPEMPYVPRSRRPEWVLVATTGRVPIDASAPKNVLRWRKIRDLSSTVEEWLIT